MKTFTIDAENHITAFAGQNQIRTQDGSMAIFSSAENLAAVAADWPASRLRAIWNSLPGVKPVHKFTDRKTAARRIFAVVQGMETVGGAAGKMRGGSAGIRLEAREGSKKAQVLALLRTSEGASVKEIMDAMAWQSHTVRGFVSGTLVRKMGLEVQSFRRGSGERAYRVV